MFNKIHNLDMFEGHKLIPDKSIDLIITDLPFGTTKCKWDILIPLDKLWVDYKRIIKDNGTILLFGTGIFFAKVILSNEDMFKYDIVWEKERPVNIFLMKRQIGRVHENIAVFYKGKQTYNPIMEERENRTIGVFGKDKVSKTHENQIYKYSKNYDNTKVYPRSVIIKFNRELKGNIHPTQKPIGLMKYLVQLYSNENDLILDSCIGSGSTIIACKECNRQYIGFELDKEIFDKAYNRIEEYINIFNE